MKRGSLLAPAALVLLAGVAWAEPPSVPPPASEGVVQVLAETPASSTTQFAAPTVYVEENRSGPRFWLTSEYLMWWIKNGPMPVPVLTTAPPTSPAFNPAALGNPDTTILMGGRDIDHPLHQGGRFTTGLWLNREQTVGIEGSYFFLGNRTVQQFAAADGALTSPILANPFFDVAPGPFGNIPSANYLASVPTPGAALLTNSSRMQGAECNGFFGLLSNGNARVQLLGGFRFLELDEGLTLNTTQTDPTGFFFPGQFANTIDAFDTRNNFYGGQVGARLDFTRGRFFVQTTGKVALGSTHEVVRIKGFTTTNTGPGFLVPIPETTVPGGIYAQPTNIGESSRDRFAVAPEVTVQAGVELGRFARVFIGYNFLYLSDVARPGDQIDGTINSTQLVSFTGVPTGPLAGPSRPAPLFNNSDFWAQGINFGLSLAW